IPFAPKRSAASTALRIARRNAIRFSSWSATDSETSWASSSGFRISWMLMKTSLPVFFWISCLSLSTSCPLRPMMIPGREVKIEIFSLLAARSTSTRLTPAWLNRFFRSFLRTRSSWRRFEYSFSAYQRLRQVLLNPSRNPVGWTFWPIGLLLPLGHVHREVRGALDHLVGAAHGRGTHALLGRALARVAAADHEVVLVEPPLLVLVRDVDRVRDRRAERLLDVPGHGLLREAQDAERLGRLLAADEVEDEPGLLGRGPHVLGSRLHFEHGLLLGRLRGGGGRGRARHLGHLLDLRGVALELPGRRELAELVAHHVLRDVDGDELLPVVHGQGVA